MIWGPQNPEKNLISAIPLSKIKVFTNFVQSLQKKRKKLPKRPAERPQGPQKLPRRRQERPQRAPRAPRERPRSRQEPPQNRTEPALAAGWAPKGPPEPLGSDIGASGASFGSFVGYPGTSFPSFFGAFQGRCACCHCVPEILGRRVPAVALTLS